MKRLEALAAIDTTFAGCPIVVNCGATSRELASLERRPSHLYLLDSMGLAGPVALGVALGVRGPVAAIEGDGSLFMGLSMLVTMRALDAPNLTLIVLDNKEHASAARMPTHADRIDIAGACRGFGFITNEAADPTGLRAALEDARDRQSTCVVVATIEGGNKEGTPLLLADPVTLAASFSAFLQTGERR